MITNTYFQRASIIHSLNFWTKLLCFSLILPLVAFISASKWLPLLFLFFIAVFMLSGTSLRKFWNITKIYLISITLGLLILSLLFSTGNSQERIISGLILALRFSLLISFGVLFSFVTNPIEIPSGFMQVKIPHKFGVTLMVAYRMMPLLSKKFETIIEAQKGRGASFKFSFRKPARILLQILSLIIPLILATLTMSTKLADALISRGYNPDGKITVSPWSFKIYDLCLLLLSCLLLIWSIRL